MKKPDNVVYNNELEEYDAFKKPFPTNFTSRSFELETITNLKLEARPYFESKLFEIKSEYENLIKELEWNQMIFNAELNFNPIIGKDYYLYSKGSTTFLSIICPSEWKMICLGTFNLSSNNSWKKVN